jgi:uncharacterized protein (TIGR04141 family)
MLRAARHRRVDANALRWPKPRCVTFLSLKGDVPEDRQQTPHITRNPTELFARLARMADTNVASLEDRAGSGDEAAGTRLVLNAVLLRPAVAPMSSLSDSGVQVTRFHLWAHDHLVPLGTEEESLLEAAVPGDVAVAVVSHPTSPRPWEVFVQETFMLPGFGDQGTNLGIIIFCAQADPIDGSTRWVAFTFGAGSRILRRRASEPRFGLLIALNRIAVHDELDTARRPGLRQASYRALGAFPYQAGHRAAKDTPLDAFRIDRVIDLLSAAGGRTSGDEPGQVFGSRSLRWSHTVEDVESFNQQALVALQDFRSTRYQSDYGFVDHMVPVLDAGIEDQLRLELANSIAEDYDDVDILLPDDLVPVESEQSICYIAKPRERTAKASDRMLTMSMAASLVREQGVSGLDAELRFLDAHRNQITHACVLDCLTAELDVSNKRYVLYDGDFYQVDVSFLDRIDEELTHIRYADLDLPCYMGGAEADWNDDAADAGHGSRVCLDGEFVRLAGETPFEPCDILDASGKLVFAKRKSRSSSMTYLFVQAERSCQLLGDSGDARKQLRDLITKAAKDDQDTTSALEVVERLARPDKETEVVFALLGDWRKRGLRNLPLLTKLTLVSAIPAVRRLGYTPTVALVPLCLPGGASSRQPLGREDPANTVE